MQTTKLELKIIAHGGQAYMIAAMAGLSPSRLSEYRRGKRKIPPHHQVSLARVLHCNPEEIVGVIDAPEFIANVNS